MTTINTKKKKDDKSHLNWMAGKSFDISNPIVKLRIAASSSFFGEPQYYQQDAKSKVPSRNPKVLHLGREQLEELRSTLDAIDPVEWRSWSPTMIMEKTIDEALDQDIEATLVEAVRLRQEDHMRTTPQVILVRAANHPKSKGTGLIRKHAKQICTRADEPSVGLAYQLHAYKDKPIPNSLKKVWADKLSACSEYELAKYRMDSRIVKTVDVVNLVHAKSEAIGKLMKGELKNTKTWESMISEKGSNKEAWESAVDVMGHMALLRNLRNLSDKGVDPNVFVAKLVEGAKTGKQLPFRYVSAYNAVTNPRIRDAIEDCLKVTLENIPKFKGKTMSLCDNSGSARGATTSSMGTMQVSTIANLTGIIAAMRSDEGYVGMFGDRLDRNPIRRNSSIFDQLSALEKKSVGESTENGIWIFFKEAIQQKEHWDNIFVFSDMQAGHGGLYGTNPSEYREYLWSSRNIHIPKLINKYRKEVNPDVKIFLCQVAGYTDTIVPEFYKNTYILGGWGEGLLSFAAKMSEINEQSSQNS